MTRRFLLLLALLTASLSASAAWYPVIDPTYVRVEVGQSRTVSVRAVWTGIWVIPWSPWVFQSTRPAVAEVSGRMDNSMTTLAVITGVAPGTAEMRIGGLSPYYSVHIDVACGNEQPVQPAIADQDVIVGREISLKAVTPIADRTAFAWYHGRTGDTSRPLSAVSSDAKFVAPTVGTHYAWTMATTPCSSSTAEFQIDAHAPKQRAVRR